MTVPLKFVLIFQYISRRSIEFGFWGFETRLKFIKFGHCLWFKSLQGNRKTIDLPQTQIL